MPRSESKSKSRSRSPLYRLSQAFAELMIETRAMRHRLPVRPPPEAPAVSTSSSSTGNDSNGDISIPDANQWVDFQQKNQTHYNYDNFWWYDNRWWEWEQGKWWTKWIEFKDTGNTFTWIPWHRWRSWSK